MSSRKIRWYNTIRMKSILVIIFSCTLVLGGLSAFNMFVAQKQLHSELHRLAQVTSQRLSKHLIGPVWDLDHDLVNSTLEAEMLEGNIQAIIVWDEDATRIFSARERGPDGRPQPSRGSVIGDLIEASHEVNNGNKAIGEVAVYVSKRQLKEKFIASLGANLITLLVLIGVMSIVMTLVMNHLIVGPIKRLAKFADDISHGNLKQNIVRESNDEIGQLAEAFHRMQTSLRVAFKRISIKPKSA